LDVKYTEAEKKAASGSGHPVPADTFAVGIVVEVRFKQGKMIYFYISRLEST
jgi:hypothetical protein